MRKVNYHSKEKTWKNTTISKLRVSDIFCLKQKSMQFPKHGKVDFHSTGKVCEKEHFKYMGFSNIFGETEIHATPKTWEKWIPIIREKYGKRQIFESYGFLKYFGWNRIPYNSQNMGKMNSHSKGKVWENTSISNLVFFLIFYMKQKSIWFPKHGKSRFPWYEKSMGKHKHFKFMGFLNISGVAKIHTIPKIWVK